MSSGDRFWPARLRWRLRGAWLWPAFIVLTLVDGVLLHLLPPVRLGVRQEGMTLIFSVIVATFGNLVLVGAIAPWLARRLAARGTLREVPEDVRGDLLRDRVGTALLALGVAGVLAAGLGSREVVVTETDATERNADAVREHVLHTRDRELIRNLETANTAKLADGYFRTCVARDVRTRHYCLFVDTRQDPVEVVRDPSSQPNTTFRAR